MQERPNLLEAASSAPGLPARGSDASTACFDR